MAADVGIAVKGSGSAPGVTTAGATSQVSGSTFYIYAFWDSFTTFTSVADSKSNTYTQVGTELTAGTARHRLYKCVNGTGGASHTATVNIGAGGAVMTVFLVEVTGCETVSPVDQSDRRVDNASPYTLAAGLTTTQANELLLSFQGGNGSGNPSNPAETGLGSSSIVVSETNGATNWCGAVAKSYKTSTGTFNPSWTQGGSSECAVYLETLKEIAGSSPATLSSATPSGTLGTTTTATLGVTTDQSSGTLYGVVDTAGNISGISAAQVKAGQNNAGGAPVASGNSSVSTTGPSVGVTGLTANTAYSYALVQNNANGDSNVITGTFTTATVVNPSNRVYGPQGFLTTILTM